MSGDGILLDGEAIKRLVGEVADELVDNAQRVIIVVGGSLLAWHGLRGATRDIDSIRRLDVELREAVRRVAARHDLAYDWLNDHAEAFAPFGFDVEACEVLLDTPRLKALGAPFRDVFPDEVATQRSSGLGRHASTLAVRVTPFCICIRGSRRLL